MTLVLEHDSDFELAASLTSIRAGVGDPTMRITSGEVWYASWTPAGPVTLRAQTHEEHLTVDVWGEGSAWGLVHAGALCGLDDRLDGFATDGNTALHWISSQHSGFRLPRSGNLAEALTWAVAAQQTSTFEAQRTYRQLVISHGTRAPGPVDLLVPPAPAVLAGLGAYDLHTFGFSQVGADLTAAAQSLDATAFGVTFIFGSYCAVATSSRATPTNRSCSSSRHDAHGP